MPERADRSLRQRDSQARDHQDLADPASSLPSTNRHDVLRDTGIRHTYTGPITSFGVSPETHTVDYNVIRARIDITPGAVTYDYGVGANYRDLLQSRTMESLAQKLASGRDLTKEELNFLAKTSPNDNRSWQSFHHSMMLHADSQTFTRALNPEELRQIVFKDLFGNEAATHSFMPGEIAEELQKRPLDLARIKELTALVDPNNEQAFDTAIKTAAARHHALKIVESALDFANHKLNSHTGEIAETALKDLELSPEEIEQLELENAKEKNKDYKGKLKAFSEEFALGAYPEIQELNDIDIKKYKDHFSSQIEEISKIAEKERTKEQINTLVQSQQAIKECERLEKLKELKSTILAGDTSDLEKSKAIDEANKIIEKLTSSEARVLLNPQFFKDHPELAEKGLSCLASNAYLDTEAAEKSNAEVQQHLKEKLTSFYRSKIDSRLKAAFPESYDSLDNNDSYQIVLDNLARNYADRFLTLHSVDTEKTKAFYEAMQKKNRDPEDSQKNAAFIAASKELAEEEKNPTANFDSRSKELMSSIQTLHAGVELVSVLETVKGNIKAALYGEKGRTQEEIDSILDEFTKIISKPELTLQAQYDLIISVNLLSQIIVIWRDIATSLLEDFAWAKTNERGQFKDPINIALENSKRKLEIQHLNMLNQSKAKRIALIYDTHFFAYEQNHPIWDVENAVISSPEVSLSNFKLAFRDSWLWHLAPQGIEYQDYGLIHQVVAYAFKT